MSILFQSKSLNVTKFKQCDVKQGFIRLHSLWTEKHKQIYTDGDVYQKIAKKVVNILPP